MKRFLGLLAVAFIGFGLAVAEQATVNHGVSLRRDPSTQNPPIGHLSRGDTVTLLAHRPRKGFYHVQLEDGTKGWVGVRYVTPESGDGTSTTSTTTTTTTTTTTNDADLVNMLFAAHTTPVPQPLRVNGQSVCGPNGSPAKALNKNKNRTDIPSESAYVPIQWQSLRDLPSSRQNDLPGAPVRVEGFISHQVKAESGESTNCGLTDPDEVDWHIYLTNQPNQGIKDAVIVETTPRTRPLHHWDKSALDALVNQNIRVRISGWLMFDSEHVGAVGTQRATVWEVHPITKIEVQKNGQWVDLDSNQ